MNNLKRCSTCITPETHESITYDENNVCSVCKQVEFKNDKIDWTKKKNKEVTMLATLAGADLINKWFKVGYTLAHYACLNDNLALLETCLRL